MRLSKEERIVLRFIKGNGGFIKDRIPSLYPTIGKLIEKGILESRIVHSYKRIGSYAIDDLYYISLSDCGYDLLEEHPELLYSNAFSAFLGRLCTFIKEHWIIALSALILIISAIMIIVHEYG